MRRAEAFIEAVKPTRLSEVSEDQITAFFHDYGRRNQMSEWPFRQMVQAVQLLVVDLADSAAGNMIDWDY